MKISCIPYTPINATHIEKEPFYVGKLLGIAYFLSLYLAQISEFPGGAMGAKDRIN